MKESRSRRTRAEYIREWTFRASQNRLVVRHYNTEDPPPDRWFDREVQEHIAQSQIKDVAA